MNTESSDILEIEKRSSFPKVSVIVPVYNVKGFLEEALNSLLNQQYKNLEIILIDDGSNDGSEDICDRFAAKDSRITVIHQDNRGVSAARNTGLDMMTGDFVAFLDSDDSFHPAAIEMMVNAMLKECTDMVVCRYNLYLTKNYMKEGEPKWKTSVNSIRAGVYSSEEAAREFVDRRLSVHLWNKLFRRELFNTIRYPFGMVFEDIVMFLPLLERAEKVCVIDDVLVNHRKWIGSITSEDFLSITTTETLKHVQDQYNSHLAVENYVRNHTPSIFTEKQLENTERQGARLLVNLIYRNSGYRDSEHVKIVSWLEEQLAKTDVDTKKLDRGTRIAYAIHNCCPKLMPLVYVLYRHGYRIINRKRNV